MSTPAFTPSVALSAKPAFAGRALPTASSLCRKTPAFAVPSLSMSAAADRFMFRSQTYEAKQAAAATGVYTVQCAEASGGSNTAEATRMAALASNFRLRQASVSARFKDLYETRRAAVIQAAGSHDAESYAVRFPARTAAAVAGRAEALRACTRYFPPADPAAEYMTACVDRQYKAKRVDGGVYSTSCCDGRMPGDAENARVAALSAQYRARHFPPVMHTQMRYNAVQEAVALARGACGYEEAYFAQFPKMAGAMRYSTGTYAASINGSTLPLSGPELTVKDQVEGVNLKAFWPSNEIRPAIKKYSAPWMPSSIKDYSPMSQSALAYGIKAQSEPFKPSKYEGWRSGWQAKPSLAQ